MCLVCILHFVMLLILFVQVNVYNYDIRDQDILLGNVQTIHLKKLNNKFRNYLMPY